MNNNILEKLAKIPLGGYVWEKYRGKYREALVCYVSVNSLKEITFTTVLSTEKYPAGNFIRSRCYLYGDIGKIVYLEKPEVA